ncbi:hypothetical protein DFA_05410 [Cavenderia fasciculata]|uniref:Chitin-binding type-4 domain-containing protein n=1 Tax=Cavenderia fasciculata TaxID=261658 RepID=F4PL56_CACFS|nr:uncharacterized protein DFA_05410 [Cavenderia fasciculata]EGG23278.1 hypothetical protein DFA_05410 [Cavenderia fasciculata]|eukprot:XP_004361129.1 hypothetical protein DFA_05410 [Cavenderia fasciculata]
MKFINSLYIFVVVCGAAIMSLSLVSGHGFMIEPKSRQFVCNSNPSNSIWWPENGDGIVDAGCKAAFKYVKARGGNAQYQFTQANEYSVNIPQYANGYSALTAAVPQYLCSANADGTGNFGDKTGMSAGVPSLVGGAWTVGTTYQVASTSVTSKTVNFTFCATATHSPSFWEIYITNPGVNVDTTNLTWNHVSLVQSFGNIVPVTGSWTGCPATKAYIFTVTLPTRFAKSTIISRWQRDDPVGECFINCCDILFTV